MNDGRDIDTSLAVLEGEASHQKVTPGKNAPEAEPPHLEPRPLQTTYYDRPMIKQPVWVWTIPTYFFVGGAAGAAMTLALAVQLFGGKRLRRFDERCRWVGAIGGGIGSALLIYDLGRRSRFLFMLRVFRPTSPMSVGSWVLALATPLSAGSALLTMSRGWLWDLGYMGGVAAGVLGMPLATYTAVLISNTAVPLWSETRRSMPLLFGASSMASLGSILDLMDLDRREHAISKRFGTAGRIAELVAEAAVEREAGKLPRVAQPLRQGLSGTLWRTATVLTGASLVVSLLPGRSRKRRMVSGVLGILGSACVRFAVFHAGKISARDPHATLAQQGRAVAAG